MIDPGTGRLSCRHLTAASGAGLVVAGLLLLAACSEQSASGKVSPAAPPGVPVMAATVTQKPVPVQVRAVGTVQAVSSVMIKSQVDGQVSRVHFQEGQDVRKGDILFTLDPGPFEATLRQAKANLARERAQLLQAEAALSQSRAAAKQAEANLARDMAQLENAKAQERRYKTLIDDGAVSSEQYDTVRTAAAATVATAEADRAAIASAQAAIQSAEATVANVKASIEADQAVVDNAQIQLDYSMIRAPMEGRAGNLLVHPGSAIKARDDSSPMVMINQIQPIYVAFSVPQKYLADIKKYMAGGTLQVGATPQGQEGNPIQGNLTFINNTVDTSTASIQLKATFSNADNTLWPGQFLNVLLTLTTEPNAVVIPSQAIQTGQQGPYVFVIKSDLTVETRDVVVERTVGPDAVIQQGLAPGERVVADGQVRLVPGARVEIRTSPTPTPAERKAG
ncbi:MAG TPA: efflux RND transporter periplasmic adaptor subunit [Candidatus Methylomirabilis sp.]|nr:efflux RND transporter periplasmic adaptor subunit [Candidatus Methylomirabilis sp.]